MFSEKYHEAVARARAHHLASKTYSGRLLRPHALFLYNLIQRYGVRSVLDYGCGKGQQYTWVSDGKTADVPAGQTIEQYWGLNVDKFDPAWPPFAEMPPKRHQPHGWDLVLCTHVLGSVPLVDLPRFLRHVAGHANDVLYIAEKVGEVGKQVNPDAEEFPRFSRAQWVEAIRSSLPSPTCTVWLSTRERVRDAVITTRHIVAGPWPLPDADREPGLEP
jgi:hypothetical protein